jgi:hypothetical protein
MFRQGSAFAKANFPKNRAAGRSFHLDHTEHYFPSSQWKLAPFSCILLGPGDLCCDKCFGLRRKSGEPLLTTSRCTSSKDDGF